jgi:hypothetical protein
MLGLPYWSLFSLLGVEMSTRRSASGFGSVVFVAAASVVMIRTGEIARMLGQLGLIVAAIQVIYLFTAFFTEGFMVGSGAITIAGFTLLGFWLLAVSIAMIIRAPAT